MVVNIYSICFLLSVLLFCLLVVIADRQKVVYFVLVFIAISINSLGYYLLSTSKTLEAALISQKIIYLGGVMVPIFISLGTLQLCHIKIKRWVSFIIVSYTLITLNFSFTVGYNDLFYKNVKLETKHGMSYLIKDYGPTHILFTSILFSCTLICFMLIIRYMIKKNHISYKTSFSLLFCELLVISCYLYRRITHSDIEWFVVAYILDELIIISLIKKLEMYHVSESVANSLETNTTNGYIVFDKKGKFTVANEIAKQYLPEINNLKTDYTLNKEDTPILFKYFSKHLASKLNTPHEYVIESNGHIFKCIIKNLNHDYSNKTKGFLIQLIDDTKQQNYLKLMNNYNEELEEETRLQTEHIRKMHDKMILNIADMIESRDISTGGHIKRTSNVVKILADKIQESDEYDISYEFFERVIKAAPMHDLGKIAIDDRILRKPGKFDIDEYDIMKTHSEKGEQIITQILEGFEDIQFVIIAQNIAHYHHEKWNGTGYPMQLKGEEIPLEARIMALADVFDALVSERCYKKALDYNTAFQVIKDSLNEHFDPKLGEIFITCRPQLEAYYDTVINKKNDNT